MLARIGEVLTRMIASVLLGQIANLVIVVVGYSIAGYGLWTLGKWWRS